jgi:hypothetical protein
MKKIIILFDYYFINGSFIDAVEYYIYLKSIFKERVYLAFLNNRYKNNLDFILKDRYKNLDLNNLYKNVIELKKIELVYQKDILILLDYTTIETIYNFINENNLIILSNFNERFINKYPKLNKYPILSEMPYHYNNQDNKYIFKFLFDYYKNYDSIDDKILVRAISFKNINYNKYNLDENKVILSTNFNNLITKDHFSSFNKFVYISNKEVFDQKPRIFIECKYYNKEIEYYSEDEDNIFDGAYYRYNWILNNKIEDRNFNDSDEVIKIINRII